MMSSVLDSGLTTETAQELVAPDVSGTGTTGK